MINQHIKIFIFLPNFQISCFTGSIVQTAQRHLINNRSQIITHYKCKITNQFNVPNPQVSMYSYIHGSTHALHEYLLAKQYLNSGFLILSNHQNYSLMTYNKQ